MKFKSKKVKSLEVLVDALKQQRDVERGEKERALTGLQAAENTLRVRVNGPCAGQYFWNVDVFSRNSYWPWGFQTIGNGEAASLEDAVYEAQTFLYDQLLVRLDQALDRRDFVDIQL